MADSKQQPLLINEQNRLQEEEEEYHPLEASHSQPCSSLLRNLYIAHFLARWDSRMWDFCVGLYMIKLWPHSLILTAIYGVVESSSAALFGPYIGQLVDRLTYLQVLRLWLVTQNLSFIVAGGSVVALLATIKTTNFSAFISLVSLTNACGAIGVLSTLAGTILIEREWVVVISEGHSADVLTQMNSTIRRIDLICKLLAPVASGFIISFVSIKASAVTLVCWNTVAVWLEYLLYMSVYKGMPALLHNNQKRVSRLLQQPIDPEKGASTSPLISPESMSSSVSEGCKEKMGEWLSKAPFIMAWRVYLKQNVVLPGVALALLNFTVLSFGTLMTATLEWEGIPAYIIGLARGGSAMIGVSATFVYPFVQRKLSTLKTGLWSIWSQWTCLLICIGSIGVNDQTSSAYMLIAGVAASRLGYWVFDLSMTQQMQDHVPDCDRCIVGGVQNSLQSAICLLLYLMGVVISNPEDFWKMSLISFASVTLAAILYSIHVYRVRKHLVHFQKLIMMVRSTLRRFTRVGNGQRSLRFDAEIRTLK
ncbi:Solute carrier family 40 member 2 [Linum perenne]